jgi:hypothetical protein
VNEGGTGEHEEHASGLANSEPVPEQEDPNCHGDQCFKAETHDDRRRHVVGANCPGEERGTEQEGNDHNCGGDEASESLGRLHECRADAEGERSAKDGQHGMARSEHNGGA